MPKSMWTLVPKIRAEHAEDHRRFLEERAALVREFESIGRFARIFSPAKDRRGRALKAEIATLDARIAACVGNIGYELDPPLIGIDEKATSWYRAHLMEDPDAWPLPPEEMIAEMRGTPVWHLANHPELQHLDIGWPKGGYPVPANPLISIELGMALAQPLSAERAVELGERLREEVLAAVCARYPVLSRDRPQELFAALQTGRLPRGATGVVSEEDRESAMHGLTAAQWLLFWGGHGYAFDTAEAPRAG